MMITGIELPDKKSFIYLLIFIVIAIIFAVVIINFIFFVPYVSASVPPSVSDFTIGLLSYCLPGGYGAHTFYWVYSDSDNDKQEFYELQGDDNSNFASPEINRKVRVSDYNCTSDCDNINFEIVNVSKNFPDNSMSYDTSYYWRVRVWDNTGEKSFWVQYYDVSDPDGDANFSSLGTARDQYPSADGAGQWFDYSPSQPEITDTVRFDETTSCPGLCDVSGTSGSNPFSWTFQDGVPNSANSTDNESMLVQFSLEGNKAVEFRATDLWEYPPIKSHPAGWYTHSCYVKYHVPVSTSSPIWKEITAW